MGLSHLESKDLVGYIKSELFSKEKLSPLSLDYNRVLELKTTAPQHLLPRLADDEWYTLVKRASSEYQLIKDYNEQPSSRTSTKTKTTRRASNQAKVKKGVSSQHSKSQQHTVGVVLCFIIVFTCFIALISYVPS